MKKSHKIALWLAAVLTILAIGGIVLLRTMTDSERLKTIARDYARKNWSRELSIGELSLTFKPTPQFHATNVTLSNPPWAHDKTLVEIKELHARVDLWPLLSKKVVVHGIDINGFKLNLEQAADGKKSWSLATAPGADKTAQDRPILSNVVMDSVNMVNGTLVYRNREAAVTSWTIAKAGIESSSGWRNVILDVDAAQDKNALKIHGKFDDISRLGMKDAVTNGELRLQAGPATAIATGALPIDPGLHSFKFKLSTDAPSLNAAFAMVGLKQTSPAAFNAMVELESVNDVIDARAIKLQLGKLTVSGDVHVTPRADIPVFDANLTADRLDWVQTRRDLGLGDLPPKPAGEMFHDRPLPWNLLVQSAGMRGTVRTNIRWLKLRSGLEMTDVLSNMNVDDGKLAVNAFDAKMLGGTVKASATIDSAKRSARIDLKLKDALLETWVVQTRKKVAIDGGRMQIHAAVDVSGKSMKDLAASVTGPVTFDIGKATVHSKKMTDAETLLVGLSPFFTPKGGDQIDLACIGATLPFKRGVARSENIIGMRSDASQLLTSGVVDLRQQTLDLHGPIYARAGISIGVSTFANELRIAGRIPAPKVGLDESAAPGVIARVAAAILTGGASIIGTTLWDGAQAAPNPCTVALANAPKAKTAQKSSKRPARKN